MQNVLLSVVSNMTLPAIRLRTGERFTGGIRGDDVTPCHCCQDPSVQMQDDSKSLLINVSGIDGSGAVTVSSFEAIALCLDVEQ